MRNILQFTFGGILLRLISRVFLSVIFIIFSFVGNAQERNVTGKITNRTDNAPITGATVRIKGTERGTTATANGTFKISVSENLILVYLRYQQRVVSINFPLYHKETIPSFIPPLVCV